MGRILGGVGGGVGGGLGGFLLIQWFITGNVVYWFLVFFVFLALFLASWAAMMEYTEFDIA